MWQFDFRILVHILILFDAVGDILAEFNDAPVLTFYDSYRTGDAAFPVASEMIIGKESMVLIDAQFQKSAARDLVSKMKSYGKKLQTIFITHSDPDFYFGLGEILKYFPNTTVCAANITRTRIEATKDQKLAYWKPIMGDEAPEKIVVPELLRGDRLCIDDHEIIVKGDLENEPCKIYLSMPKLNAIFGGIAVTGNNIHVWMADTLSNESIQNRIDTLNQIMNEPAQRVIPSHLLPGAQQTKVSVEFSKNYVLNFVQQWKLAGNDTQRLIDEMKRLYPNLKDISNLEFSAQVATGRVEWVPAC